MQASYVACLSLPIQLKFYIDTKIYYKEHFQMKLDLFIMTSVSAPS